MAPAIEAIHLIRRQIFTNFEPYPRLSAVFTTKGQITSKANCQEVNSSKKRTNEFVYNYYAMCFCLFFGRNMSLQKDFSKLSDLYPLANFCPSPP